jgi:hypothetical protein
MPAPHLANLYRHYDAILNPIGSGAIFDSHWFIGRLAQAHQTDYIQALNHYAGHRAAFKVLHRSLSSRLRRHRQAIYAGRTNSGDVFGDNVSNANWRRR